MFRLSCKKIKYYCKILLAILLIGVNLVILDQAVFGAGNSDLLTWSTNQHVILIGPEGAKTPSTSFATSGIDGRICSYFDANYCSNESIIKSLEATSHSASLTAPNGKSFNPIFLGLGLDMCAVQPLENCIDSFTANQNGKAIQLRRIGYAPSEVSWTSNEAQGIPNSSPSTLWELSTSSGSIFHFQLRTILNISGSGANMKFLNLAASIVPYRIADLHELPMWTNSSSLNFVNAIDVQNRACPLSAWHDTNICAIPDNFPVGVRFKLQFQLKSSVGNWVIGRLLHPQFVSKTLKNGMQALEIEAEPEVTPIVAAIISADTSKQYADGAPVGYYGEDISRTYSLSKLELIRPIIHDQATDNLQIWSFSTTSSSIPKNILMKCAGGDSTHYLIHGYSTSNSLMYQEKAPNYSDRTFSYQLAGMHLSSDGLVQTGIYEFGVAAQFEKCLYSSQKIPINASIFISDQDGDKSGNFTQVIKYDSSHYWLQLTAAGFHYSNPLIKIKI